jgi:hypothetical protein
MDYWQRILNQKADRRRVLVLAAGAAALVACGDDGSEGPAAGENTDRQTSVPAAGPRLEVPDPRIAVRGEFIDPKLTDAAIDAALEPHYVAFPAASARGQLFLFLQGGDNLPSQFRLIADQGARGGFHVVVLRYMTSRNERPSQLCQSDRQADVCYEETISEIVYGNDRTPRLSVSRANSIENRALKLLDFLARKYPKDGWISYKDRDSLRWSSIVLAGFSLGGVHAAFIAKDHELARVSMLSAPGARVGGEANVRPVDSVQPAAWLLGPHKTPAERYYAFGHADDETNNWELMWKAVGLGLTDFGPIVKIDQEATPYRNSHALLTEAQTPMAKTLSTGVDTATPKTAAGQPIFAPVWQYMCFA